MRINSPVFGEIEIDQEKIVQFEKGIPGFPDEESFILLELPDTPFFVMQSIKDELFFYLINPFEFFSDYEIQLPESVVARLGAIKAEDIAVYCIVTIYEDFQKSTVNLKAPIVIHSLVRKGKQVILNESNYNIRQALFMPEKNSTPVEQK
ncbi:MAG: flagellar assembly protein FliW [Ignavibacteriales bacterium]